MKKLFIVGPLVIIMAIGLALNHHTKVSGNQAPYPASLQASGYGPCHYGPIQITSGTWYIHLNYSPLNRSASLTVLNLNENILDSKLVGTSTGGTLTLSETIHTPVYIDCYAGNYSINAGK